MAPSSRTTSPALIICDSVNAPASSLGNYGAQTRVGSLPGPQERKRGSSIVARDRSLTDAVAEQPVGLSAVVQMLTEDSSQAGPIELSHAPIVGDLLVKVVQDSKEADASSV